MQKVKGVLVCLVLVAVIAGIAETITLIRDLDKTVLTVNATAAALPAQVSLQGDQIRREVLDIARDATKRADRQITALRTDTLARVDALSSLLDKRTGEVVQMADARTSQALGTIDGIRTDLKPTLAGTAALVVDAKDSWDDLYFDVKASVESGTVTMHSVAVASEAVSSAAPKLAASAVGIGSSVNGIAADVHTATTDFVAPKTFWQRLKTWLETAGKIGARFL